MSLNGRHVSKTTQIPCTFQTKNDNQFTFFLSPATKNIHAIDPWNQRRVLTDHKNKALLCKIQLPSGVLTFMQSAVLHQNQQL